MQTNITPELARRELKRRFRDPVTGRKTGAHKRGQVDRRSRRGGVSSAAGAIDWKTLVAIANAPTPVPAPEPTPEPTVASVPEVSWTVEVGGKSYGFAWDGDDFVAA